MLIEETKNIRIDVHHLCSNMSIQIISIDPSVARLTRCTNFKRVLHKLRNSIVVPHLTIQSRELACSESRVSGPVVAG